jgi:hypothetical protein
MPVDKHWDAPAIHPGFPRGLTKLKCEPKPTLIMNSFRLVLCALLGLTALPAFPAATKSPVRLAIIGLVHTHGHGFLPRALAYAEVLDAARKSAATGRRIDLPAEARPSGQPP